MIENYYHFFVDLWRYFRKYFIAYDGKDAVQMVADLQLIDNKYPGPFAKKIILAVFEELERVGMERRNKK